jgi:hypothetical protein
MNGPLRVRRGVTPDGKSVATTLPNGATFFLGSEEALAYAMALLITVRSLYEDSAELDQAVIRAYDSSHRLLDDPPRVH